ncbi:MAG: isoprenylcysteine carboxylmethyltransferase family protein [Rhodobiaceae bacterium]|nr:isoprenylcysteine carboxylmethyltransferase family protein [Rhodobiaceae bacterium]
MIGVASLVYLIAFLGNIFVTPSIDRAATAPVGLAIAIDVALVTLFGLQHSIMARPAFKRVWTRIVPKAAERSTYLLATALALVVLFWQWRAIPAEVWSIESAVAANAMLGLYLFGWALVLLATFQINHFDLFGLRQVWLAFRGHAYRNVTFREPWLYRVCRHPMQLGVLIALWAAPTMSVGRLVFAIAMTVYIFIGLWFEERDLIAAFGERYTAYMKRVPKLIPFVRIG